MSIRIIDNFLSDEEYSTLKENMKSLRWEYSHNVTGEHGHTTKCEDKYDWQMVHYFYLHPFNISDQYNIVNSIIQKINPIVLYRAKMNLNPVTSEHIEHGFHTDSYPVEHAKKFKTAVYYINTNNGYTKFDNGEEVKSQANRLVIFPGDMLHTGSTCTDQKNRLVLNLMYLEGDPIA
jgi:hypothetical protein